MGREVGIFGEKIPDLESVRYPEELVHQGCNDRSEERAEDMCAAQPEEIHKLFEALLEMHRSEPLGVRTLDDFKGMRVRREKLENAFPFPGLSPCVKSSHLFE